MNNKLDELGIALGHAKNELNSLIVEFKENTNTQMNEVYLMDIGRKAIEIHNLDEKWHDAEYKEFMSDDQDQSIFNDDHDIHYDEAIRDEDLTDMDR